MTMRQIPGPFNGTAAHFILRRGRSECFLFRRLLADKDRLAVCEFLAPNVGRTILNPNGLEGNRPAAAPRGRQSQMGTQSWLPGVAVGER